MTLITKPTVTITVDNAGARVVCGRAEPASNPLHAEKIAAAIEARFPGITAVVLSGHSRVTMSRAARRIVGDVSDDEILELAYAVRDAA